MELSAILAFSLSFGYCVLVMYSMSISKSSFSVPLAISILLLMMPACGSSEESESDPADNEAAEGSEPAGPGNEIFYLIDRESGPLEVEWEQTEEYELRGEAVRINPKLFEPDRLRRGDTLLLNLFEDLELTGEVTRTGEYAGVQTVTGRFGDQQGDFTFSMEQGRLLGSVRMPPESRYVMIRYWQEEGVHLVIEVDPERLDVLPGAPPLTPPDTLDNE